MSSTYERPPAAELRHDLAALRGNWLWFVVLGVALIVLGLVALGSVVMATLATAVAIGALMLVGGVSETIGAFWCRAWSGFFFHLLSGILSIVVGVLFRVSRALAQQPGARIIAFHIVEPPAAVTEDGRVIAGPQSPNPVDLWADYRAAHADAPGVTVKHSVVVGKHSDAARLLTESIGQTLSGVLVVMGTHGRTGLSRLIWGNRAEEVVRTMPCAVLVVKEPTAS
jgi:nucleotide-binding universal stress UspA family protein